MTPEEQRLIQIPTKTDLRIAVRPSPIVLRTLVYGSAVDENDLSFIPLYSQYDPVTEYFGDIDDVQYGHTVEVSNGQDATEKLKVIGLHRTPLGIVIRLGSVPEGLGVGQVISIFDAGNILITDATISTPLGGWFLASNEFYLPYATLSNAGQVGEVTVGCTVNFDIGGVNHTVSILNVLIADFADGLTVANNSITWQNGWIVNVYDERRLWQKPGIVAKTLPIGIPRGASGIGYGTTASFDSRLTDTTCLVTLDTPQFGYTGQITALFPSGVTNPATGQKVYVGWDDEGKPAEERQWLVKSLDPLPIFGNLDEAIELQTLDPEITVLKDGQPYNSQNAHLGPVAYMYGHQAKPFDHTTGQAVFTLTAGGYSLEGQAISAYSWDCQGGTIQGDGTPSVTVTVNAPGWYEVFVQVRDATRWGQAYRYLYAYDEMEMDKAFGRITFRSNNNGFSTQVSMRAEDVTDYQDGAFVLAWRQSTYGTVKQNIGKDVVFAGYINEGSLKIDDETNTVTFDAATIDDLMSSTPCDGWAMQYGNPTDWQQMLDTTISRLMYHHLHWNSNVAELCNVYFPNNRPEMLLSFSTDPSDLLSICNRLATKIMAQVRCDQVGNLYIIADMQIESDTVRDSFPVTGYIDYHNIRQDVTFVKQMSNKVRQVLVCGEIFDGEKITVAGGATPYPVPSLSGGQVSKYDRIPIANQQQAIDLSKRLYAKDNRQIGEVQVKFSGDWSGLLSPAWQQWFTMSVSEQDTGGLFLWINKRLRIISATYIYDTENAVMSTEAVLEPEAITIATGRQYSNCQQVIPVGQRDASGSGGFGGNHRERIDDTTWSPCPRGCYACDGGIYEMPEYIDIWTGPQVVLRGSGSNITTSGEMSPTDDQCASAILSCPYSVFTEAEGKCTTQDCSFNNQDTGALISRPDWPAAQRDTFLTCNSVSVVFRSSKRCCRCGCVFGSCVDQIREFLEGGIGSSYASQLQPDLFDAQALNSGMIGSASNTTVTITNAPATCPRNLDGTELQVSVYAIHQAPWGFLGESSETWLWSQGDFDGTLTIWATRGKMVEVTGFRIPIECGDDLRCPTSEEIRLVTKIRYYTTGDVGTEYDSDVDDGPFSVDVLNQGEEGSFYRIVFRVTSAPFNCTPGDYVADIGRTWTSPLAYGNETFTWRDGDYGGEIVLYGQGNIEITVSNVTISRTCSGEVTPTPADWEAMPSSQLVLP